MILFRRLFLVVSIVVTGSLGMAAAAIAAGGGGGLPPGNYSFSDTGALAQFGAPLPNGFSPQFVVNVDRIHSDFRPTSGPHQVVNTTQVTIQISTATIAGFGCFDIPSSDFKVSSDLQRASLHTTLTTPCSPIGPGAPVIAPKTLRPFAGSGGGGLPASLALDITWTGDGIIGTTHDNSTFQCAGYTLKRTLTGRAASVSASGTVSSPSTGTLLSDSPADQGTSLRKTNTIMNITNVQLNACQGLQVF